MLRLNPTVFSPKFVSQMPQCDHQSCIDGQGCITFTLPCTMLSGKWFLDFAGSNFARSETSSQSATVR
eukprot:m.1600675 g.1600675  ORF g.1600675 m.1600675 type:complete len:68 (+) comp25350_c0_seq3:1464-1667(+)